MMGVTTKKVNIKARVNRMNEKKFRKGRAMGYKVGHEWQL